MARISMNVSDEAAAALKSTAASPYESYDTSLRRLLGLSFAGTPKPVPVVERDEFKQVMALEAGKSVTLRFDWDEPGRPALNARLLAQVVRRVRERTGWRIHTEGSAAGLKVTRIS